MKILCSTEPTENESRARAAQLLALRVVGKLTNGLRARKSRRYSWHRLGDANPLRNVAIA